MTSSTLRAVVVLVGVLLVPLTLVGAVVGYASSASTSAGAVEHRRRRRRDSVETHTVIGIDTTARCELVSTYEQQRRTHRRERRHVPVHARRRRTLVRHVGMLGNARRRRTDVPRELHVRHVRALTGTRDVAGQLNRWRDAGRRPTREPAPTRAPAMQY